MKKHHQKKNILLKVERFLQQGNIEVIIEKCFCPEVILFYQEKAKIFHVRKLLSLYCRRQDPDIRRNILTIVQAIDWKKFSAADWKCILGDQFLGLEVPFQYIFPKIDLSVCSAQTRQTMYRIAACGENLEVLEQIVEGYPSDETLEESLIHTLVSMNKKESLRYILQKHPELLHTKDSDGDTVEEMLHRKGYIL